MNAIPQLRARRIADPVDHTDGFVMKPILPHMLLPHSFRRGLDKRELKRCGYCGELVKRGPEWENHKDYCWKQQWIKGSYKGSKKLRVVDRAFASGDRSMRR